MSWLAGIQSELCGLNSCESSYLLEETVRHVVAAVLWRAPSVDYDAVSAATL